MTGQPASVAEGLFEIVDGSPRLVGSRCLGCAAIYFPQALSCRNPRCDEKRIERALLADRGILLSFTVQHYRPPPLFRMDDWQPYAIGLVDLGDGVEVMGMLTDSPLDQIRIGMAVHLVTETLFVDEERGPVSTYKFAPDGEGHGS